MSNYSSYKIYFNSDKEWSSHEIVGEDGSLDQEIIKNLFILNKKIGVTAVRSIKKEISWEFKNNWYSFEEIERMLKMKAFA